MMRISRGNGDQEDLSPGGGVLQSVHNTWPCAAQWLQPGVLLQFPAAAAVITIPHFQFVSTPVHNFFSFH